MLNVLFLLVFTMLIPQIAHASPEIPVELLPWISWVEAKHPTLNCPIRDTQTECVWPGRLTLAVTPTDGRFSLDVRTDRSIAVPLPGGPGQWPSDILIDGSTGVVGDKSGTPVITVETGQHRITGHFYWTRMPQSIETPSLVAQITLTVDGEVIEHPKREPNGAVHLGASNEVLTDGDRLQLEVFRKIDDNIPSTVLTHLSLRVSGRAREVNFGVVTPLGTLPVLLSSQLPAQLNAKGELLIQLRPGAHIIELTALHLLPIEGLSPPVLDKPWPKQEIWSVQSHDRLRSVRVEGAPGIDPQRTSLPQSWRNLPAYVVTPQSPLRWTELRRGEPFPAPNALHLKREFWLDADGTGYTVRDSFTGQMNQGWSLQAQAPLLLGHLKDQQTDRVIVDLNDSAGVTLRDKTVQLVAESRIEGQPKTLSAVGWNTDVQSLSATLRLPPGFTLLAATGLENSPGWIGQWSLYDLFFTLLLSVAFTKLLGKKWGLIALISLTLTRHVPGAPQWLWVLALICTGLERTLPETRLSAVNTAVKLTVGFFLAINLLLFGHDEIKQGLFPGLAPSSSISQVDASPAGVSFDQSEVSFEQDREEAQVLATRAPAKRRPKKRGYSKRPKAKTITYQQADPSEIVQTGPGIPSRSSQQIRLEWSGPITSDHPLSFWLLSPATNRLLHLLHTALLLLLAARLFGLSLRKTPTHLATMLLIPLLIGSLPRSANAAPSTELLKELEQRVTQKPSCDGPCVIATNATLQLSESELHFTFELHVQAKTAWPLPGPTAVWMPNAIYLDGRPTWSLLRTKRDLAYIRLEPGVHTLRLDGPVPLGASATLQLESPPKNLIVRSVGWLVDGLKPNGQVDRSLQLTRANRLNSTDKAPQSKLQPWFEVQRDVSIDRPWTVNTTITRRNNMQTPLAVRVPLLPGESLIEGDIQTEDGFAKVRFQQNESSLSWSSTLEESESLLLSLPKSALWTETWNLNCGTMYQCSAKGPPPTHHVQAQKWSPKYRVWPGDSVKIAVNKPVPISGQTSTIDSAVLNWTPGPNLTLAKLELTLRTSQGGQHKVTLPKGARLQKAAVDSTDQPVQIAQDGSLSLTTRPGNNHLLIEWQQPHQWSFYSQIPAINLGVPGVNLETIWDFPSKKRLILATFGPTLGPVPLFWTYFILLLFGSFLLIRLPNNPLKQHEWILLGLGMSQLPFAPVIIAIAFFALESRRSHPIKAPLFFNLTQLSLIIWLGISLLTLYLCIHMGLILTPNSRIEGNDSTQSLLRWYLDRSSGAMPVPAVLSIPVWIYRLFMLAWATWLVFKLMSWARWSVDCLGTEGWFRSTPKPAQNSEEPVAPQRTKTSETD